MSLDVFTRCGQGKGQSLFLFLLYPPLERREWWRVEKKKALRAQRLLHSHLYAHTRPDVLCFFFLSVPVVLCVHTCECPPLLFSFSWLMHRPVLCSSLFLCVFWPVLNHKEKENNVVAVPVFDHLMSGRTSTFSTVFAQLMDESQTGNSVLALSLLLWMAITKKRRRTRNLNAIHN